MKKVKKKKVSIKRLLIFFSFFAIIVGVLVGIYIFFKKDEHNPIMELSFSNRVKDLKKFEYNGANGVGWLQVQGTNIDFPILSHYDLDTEENFDYGWRSPNYTTGQNREVLLGHNLINVSNQPIRNMETLSAFEGLMAFTYEDFAQENLYISYTKGKDTTIYKIYAVRFNSYNEDDSSSFSSKKDTKKYIKTVLNDSIYDYDIDVNEDDQLLTLKTCTRYFGVNENQEFSIDARKVRDGELIDKYKVKKNDNYKIIDKRMDL